MSIAVDGVSELAGRFFHYGLGFTLMIAGSVSVLSVVVAMNELSKPPERQKVGRTTEIEIEKAPKPKPKQAVQKPKPKPRKAQKAPPRPMLAGLSSGISGIEFDLPGLRFEDLGADAGDLLATEKEVVHTSDTVDTPPRAVEQPPMQFPKKLQDKGIEGYVVLSILVNASGNIDRVKVIESKPPGTFDQVALDGIREWRFEPATYQGEAVNLWIRQKVRFELSRR